MKSLLNYLAPPSNQLEKIVGVEIDPISSVLKSVDNIAQRIGDRLGFFTSEFPGVGIILSIIYNIIFIPWFMFLGIKFNIYETTISA